ncbi:PAS domain-containing protein [Rhodanobacter sp. 115]|uniref:hybrid sensor histidine kinase/response regulator n=1 Tax=Rhodanobacter sp. FW021-MT20 TaxID=1162282 RepID=UPI000260DB66|nr:hybrid sensor histidine kinase/response regulator [Rhodanobacter sp. 115]EIL88268.1 PAS/PAC sensor hybrid histidine kinase [Rhodanobacter sp. 115]
MVDVSFLAGGGEMGALIRSHDWTVHPLGNPDGWPQALRTAIRLILNSRHQLCVFWGKDGIWFYNDAYRQTLTDERHPSSLGLPAQQVWPEIWNEIGPQIAQVMSGGNATWHENQHLVMRRDGRDEDTYWTYSYGPIDDRSAPGGVGGVLVVCTETTEQVLVSMRAMEERQSMAELFEQAPSFMAMLRGPEHVFELANPGYIRLVGEREILGRTVADALPDAAAQGFVDLLDVVYESGMPYTATATPFAMQPAPDAPVRQFYLDFVYQPIKDCRGEVIGIFVEGTDATERTRAENALRASEARLRALNADLELQIAHRMHGRARTWQLSTDIMGVLNAEGIFELSNPAWQAILGWPEETIVRTSFFDFLHPDDLARTRVAFARAIELGEPALRFENRYRHAAGGYRWLSWVAIPEDDKIYCSARDITAEKEATESLARAEAALRQAQKMEAVGQLTGGIAHDFNNLLGGIMGAMEAARAKLDQGKPEEVPRYLELSETALRRAASLTQRLLAFSRQQTLDPRPTNINRLVAGMEDLIRRTIGPSVHLKVVRAPDLWSTLVDPPQLENALLNLCINARDAMPEGGHLTIETANHVLGERSAAACELEPGPYVSLCVTDTGTGMTPDVIARAFDPFFTTKPIGQGTGLGLSMIYGFARQSGGQVRIHSEPGAGSTFCIYLPSHQAGTADNPAVQPARPPQPVRQSETILVVEDEPSIRELVCEILADTGYTVLQADDGDAGLAILQSDVPIDLLVSDVGLPGSMNGREMADQARITRPGLKILFMTGYAEHSTVGSGQLESDMHVLIKPFSLDTLRQRIRDILFGLG